MSSPRFGDPDNTLLFKICASVSGGGGGGGGVTSFNARTGAVTLTSLDVTTALGYVPADASLYLPLTGGDLTGPLRVTTEADATWNEVVFSGDTGYRVAVGDGRVMTYRYTGSGNDAWIQRTPAADNNWTGVVYSGSLRLVAVSNNGADRVMYSDDSGTTWTSISCPALEWNAICVGNIEAGPAARLVAVASSGAGSRVMTSDDDGDTWTLRSTPADNSWESVVYSPTEDLYVAVSSDGVSRVMTSPDAETWTLVAVGGSNSWRDVDYFFNVGGILVAVADTAGSNSNVMTSTDGVTWTPRTALGEFSSVAYGSNSGLIVAVSRTGIGVISSDAVTWTQRSMAAGHWSSVCDDVNSTELVAVSDDPAPSHQKVQVSIDGENWTLQGSAPSALLPDDLVEASANASSALTIGTNALAIANLCLLQTGGTLTGALTINDGANNSTALAVSGATITSGVTPFVSVAGTWNTASSPTALRVNITNTATGSSTRLFDFSVGGLPLLTLGYTGFLDHSVRAANTIGIASNGYSLTGSSALPLLSLGGTWNTSGNPSAIFLNITDTGSGSTSKLIELAVGFSPKFVVDKAGSIGTSTTGVGFFGTAPIAKPTSGANLTNNVTSGGTDNQIDNFTSLTVYSTDAAAIRNNIYQLARKLKQVNDALRSYGLLT